VGHRAPVKVEVVQTREFGNEVLDDECIALVKSAADELQVPYQEILSQAGRNAFCMTWTAPTALLFSPRKQRIAHNQNEHIEAIAITNRTEGLTPNGMRRFTKHLELLSLIVHG
jgi:acetylornithine deacetylase/succinyl-diaminopimelate desuccinylase-like protein